MIYFHYKFSDGVNEANICEKDDCMFTKVVIDEEEWDGIDIDNIGNLEDLLILAFIYEECGNLKVVVEGGELLEILTKRRSQTFCNPIFVHSVKKCCRREHFVNKQVEYREPVT